MVDLRSLEYVSDFDSNLVCGICHCPFINPVRTVCDHAFCRECFSNALSAQDAEQKTCPACRADTCHSDASPVPRFFLHSIDDLKVFCPNATFGCQSQVRRGDLEIHITNYCDFTMMPCSSPNCRLTIARKDLKDRCMHNEVSCEDCGAMVMEKDIAWHLRNRCSEQSSSCPQCHRDLSISELDEHKQDCPKLEKQCSGSEIGCKFVGYKLADHEADCTFATLLPTIQLLQSQVHDQAGAIQILQRRAAIMEDGFSTMENLLSKQSSAQVGTNSSSTNTGSSQDSHHSQDPTVTHLLSLHESLREVVKRVEDAVTNVDARASMMIINENLRVKEELAHQNAVIGSLQMQMRWMMNSRLQTQRSQTAPVVTKLNETNATRQSTTEPFPVRRLSDPARADVKL